MSNAPLLTPARHHQEDACAFPSVQETLNHPAYASAIWALEPHAHGRLPVAHGRGGPLSIYWELHGAGPTKLLVRT